jgi:hypothetical protein
MAVADISHTNSAVAQIRLAAGKFTLLPDSYFVDTLHAFLLRYVVYPFGHLYMRCRRTPTVIGDMHDWQLDEQVKDIGVPGHPKLRVQPWEFDVKLGKDAARRLTYRKPAAWPASLTTDAIITSCGKCAWQRKRAYWRQGLLSPSDVLWTAYSVLSGWQPIATAVAARFDEIVVDEIQDVDNLQLTCLEVLRTQRKRPRLVIAGDPNQAIYGWSGADPQRLSEFATAQRLHSLHLTTNFRSSQLICDVSHRFSTRPVADIACGPAARASDRPGLWLYNEKKPLDLRARFCERLDKLGVAERDAAILARTNATVEDLTNRRSEKRMRLPWLTDDLVAAAGQRDGAQGLDAELFRRLDRVIAVVAFGSTQIRNFAEDRRDEIRIASTQLLADLPPIDCDLRDWNRQARETLATCAAAVPGATPLNVNRRMRDSDKLAGMNAHDVLPPEKPMLAKTVHDAKGQSIAAVMLVARSKDVEHWTAEVWADHPPTEICEETRIAYVAMTRAERLLIIAVPEKTEAAVIEKLAQAGFSCAMSP